MSDDLDIGPSVLQPVKVDYSRALGRWIVGPLIAMLLIVLVVFYVLFRPVTVEGDSMNPTLLDGERILVTKGYTSPKRGDIVVFALLDERTGEPSNLVKRVIAVSGDSVGIQGDLAVVNGTVETPRSAITDPRSRVEKKAYQVPKGTVFVMGDNRPISLDSRHVGPIRLSAIQGRAGWVWAPISRIRRID